MSERLLLGEILAEEGVISREQLHEALLEQKRSKKRLGKVLIELGFVPEELIIHHLSDQITDILEECEENIPYLFKKPHELISKEIPSHKKASSFMKKEVEEEVYRRLDAGRKLLGVARELFRKGIYEEVVYTTYHAVHHTAQAAHHLPEYQRHPAITRMAGVKSVYTGRSNTLQVERRSIFADKTSEEINPPTKRYAGIMIKNAQAYLDRVEKHFDEVIKGR